jgi:hypothetical protein
MGRRSELLDLWLLRGWGFAVSRVKRRRQAQESKEGFQVPRLTFMLRKLTQL